MATHNYSVMGVMPSGYDYEFRDRAQQELLEHRRRGAIRAVVDQVFPFESLPEGLEQLASGRVRGKLVLEGDP